MPKSSHLDEAVAADHHVLGLDVAVHDADGVCGGQPAGDLQRDVERRHQGQRTLAQALAQRDAVDELQ